MKRAVSYQLPQSFAGITESPGMDIHRFKRALLVGAITNDFTFLENVTLNRGQSVKVLTDRAQAIKWQSSLSRRVFRGERQS